MCPELSWSLNRNAVVRRHFKRGEIICREGEYGSTAFYILEGKARVSIATPIAHVKTQGVMKRFLGKLSSKLTQRQNDTREEETSQHWIPIDAPLDLSYENPVATLKPGDLFGEMTCMSFYPRSATVRAETDCTHAAKFCATCWTSCRGTKISARSSIAPIGSARSILICARCRFSPD